MQSDIIALDRAFEDAIIAKDVAALERLASDDLVYTHSNGVVDHDRAAFVDHIVNGALSFTKITYEDTQVRLHGDCAVLTCALHLDTLRGDVKGELHFRMTHVWVREAGHWRLVASQSTRIV